LSLTWRLDERGRRRYGVSGVLSGRTVIVTGAGRGLGRAYALEIAAEGGTVVVNDVDGAAVMSVVQEIHECGGTALAVPGSVSNWTDAEHLVKTAVSSFGQIDGLVNNAGVVWMGSSHEQVEESIRSIVEVNLLGSLFVGAHVIRQMVHQGSGGAIVNVTSSTQMGIPGLAAYGATKGAVASLTYSWALELAEHGIRVNAFAPSALTGMLDPSKMPSGHLGMPEDNAPVVVYLVSELSAGVTGQVVQWRHETLCVVGHPALTPYCAPHSVYPGRFDATAISLQFGPVLEGNLQPVGWELGG
jgi:NAD(P)-dependent dehydrogenase (short-subunit alcohol dehydrogenase family)